jgi:hypothetical protein
VNTGRTITTCNSFPYFLSSNTQIPLLCESGRSVGAEDLLRADLGQTVGERERQVLGGELLDVGTLDVLSLLELDNSEDLRRLLVKIPLTAPGQDSGYATYVDRSESSTVAGGHVGVERVDSIGSRQLAVLLVHVVGTGAGVVSDPDTEVLDLQGVLLVDLVEGNDLAVGLLDLLELHQEVPEARLGNDLVGGKDSHAVELGGGVGLAREVAPNDLVLLKTT